MFIASLWHTYYYVNTQCLIAAFIIWDIWSMTIYCFFLILIFMQPLTIETMLKHGTPRLYHKLSLWSQRLNVIKNRFYGRLQFSVSARDNNLAAAYQSMRKYTSGKGWNCKSNLTELFFLATDLKIGFVCIGCHFQHKDCCILFCNDSSKTDIEKSN